MIPQAPAQVNLQYMLNASRAVLSRPSVSTFEEYERDDLNWAAIYVVVGAIITALLNALAFTINPPDLSQLPPELQGGFAEATQQRSLIGSVVSGITSTLLSYFIGLGIVYFLGRLFGGTGQFGELAFDVALYQVPLSVFVALLGVIPIPFLTGLAALAAFGYWIYLTYLCIQSGMNLPRDKALWMIIIVFFVGLALLACIAFVVALALAAVLGQQPQ